MHLSILLNVIWGGHSNQTTSARNYQWQKEGKPNAVWLIDKLLGEGHCMEAWLNWTLLKHAIQKYGFDLWD